jgi:hypothetical protein
MLNTSMKHSDLETFMPDGQVPPQVYWLWSTHLKDGAAQFIEFE